MKELTKDPNYRKLIDLALDEDLKEKGDITSNAVISPSSVCEAKITTKAAGVVAGMEIARMVYQLIDGDVVFDARFRDSEKVDGGEILVGLSGPTLSVLKGERVALNFLSYLSGIATTTNKFVSETEYTKAKIFDTRKTHPGLRSFEKYAVRVGGGSNHRAGLYDQVLIKDNHLVAAPDIKNAVESGKKMGVTEIEVENLSQLREAIQAGPDIVMLDNMDIETIRKAVSIAGDKVLLEVSGGVDLENVKAIAGSGVDRISVGSITMAALPIDMALDVIKVEEVGK